MLRALSDALRPPALLAFGLPAAPQRIETLLAPLPGAEALLVYTPAGRALLLVSVEGALTLAYEATLFELLAGARFPAPAPRRTVDGMPLARLDGHAAATCYPWPAGESLGRRAATTPQLLEVGRLLARLHQLGESHPATVGDPLEGNLLAARLPAGDAADALREVLQASLQPGAHDGLLGLPAGAAHGRLTPAHALFVGDRLSAVTPGGTSSSAPLLLDLAHALCAWALALDAPLPALRAIVAGYQAQRRLAAQERAALFHALRLAAAREGALALLAGDEGEALRSLQQADALGEAAVRAAAG